MICSLILKTKGMLNNLSLPFHRIFTERKPASPKIMIKNYCKIAFESIK